MVAISRISQGDGRLGARNGYCACVLIDVRLKDLKDMCVNKNNPSLCE